MSLTVVSVVAILLLASSLQSEPQPREARTELLSLRVNLADLARTIRSTGLEGDVPSSREDSGQRQSGDMARRLHVMPLSEPGIANPPEHPASFLGQADYGRQAVANMPHLDIIMLPFPLPKGVSGPVKRGVAITRGIPGATLDNRTYEFDDDMILVLPECSTNLPPYTLCGFTPHSQHLPAATTFGPPTAEDILLTQAP